MGAARCISLVIKGFVLAVFRDCPAEELVVVDCGGWTELVEVTNGACFAVVGPVGEVLREVLFGGSGRIPSDAPCEVPFDTTCVAFSEASVGGGFVTAGDVVLEDVLGVQVPCVGAACVVPWATLWEAVGDVEADT